MKNTVQFLFIILLVPFFLVPAASLEAAPQCEDDNPNFSWDAACYVHSEIGEVVPCLWSILGLDCCPVEEDQVDTDCVMMDSCGGAFPYPLIKYGHPIYFYQNTCGGDISCNNPFEGPPDNYLDWATTTQDVCYYIDEVTVWSSCVDGMQYAVDGTWHATFDINSPECVNVPMERECCGDSTLDLTVQGLPDETVTVQQNVSFDVAWEFENPGYESQYTCTITTPSLAGFVHGLESATLVKNTTGIISSSLSETILSLANPSTEDTLYPYELKCEPILTSVCPAASKTVNVKVTADTFTVTLTPDGEVKQVGDYVNWLAEAQGGYPPYNYQWSDGITNPWSPTKSFTERYGTLGNITVLVEARDNNTIANTDSDTGSVTIKDDRKPQ